MFTAVKYSTELHRLSMISSYIPINKPLITKSYTVSTANYSQVRNEICALTHSMPETC